MQPLNLRIHRNFLLAASIPFIALIVQWQLWSFIDPFVWFLFYPAVFFSARIGGLKVGIASTVLSALIVWYFFMPPELSFLVVDSNNLFSIVVFLIMGVLFSDVQERLKKANTKTFEALRDVRVAHEKVSQLYEKTLEAEKLKTHFFTNVSHELRTPLTLILNPVSELLKKNDLEENIRYNLEIVEKNAHSLYRHVSDLLDISKLEARQMTLQYSRVNIAGPTRLITSYFESLASSKNIHYVLKQPDELIVEVDVEKYQRILQNILSNAFRYTPPEGEILVHVTGNDTTAVIEIHDNGPGIPREQRNRIFERFQQVNRQGVHEYGGTGLGLAIVKEFIELHYGTIDILDSYETGAHFQVVLPLKAPEGAFFADSSVNSAFDIIGYKDSDYNSIRSIKSFLPEDQKMPFSSTILIVDDNQDITDFLTRILSQRYLISTASNGKEGIEKAVSLKPDLIITDIMMPVMSGDEMVRRIRENDDLADIPVIMLTAVIDEKVKNELLKQSVQDFLTKPFSIDELRSKVESIINQQNKQKGKIAEAELRYKQALDNMLEGCQIIGNDWRYLYVNQSAASFGRKRIEELTGQTIFDVYPNIKEQPIFETLKNCLDNKVPAHFETEFEFVNHSRGWFELSVHPVPEGIFILSFDITPRKLAEQEIILAKEKAEESDRLKTAFLHNISHEIRTPLNAIVGFSSILGKQDLTADKKRDYINIINTSNSQLLSIISGIIALATLEAGQEHINETETDINKLLSEVYDQFLLRHIPPEIILKYHTELAGDHALILTDPLKLTQIMINLVDNALKFTGNGNVDFGCKLVDGSLLFFVEDTGIGIPEEMHEIIFERFRQIDNSPTRKYGGSGLGLALTKGYVELLGGKIQLRSEPGKGSFFGIKLPYKPVVQNEVLTKSSEKSSEVLFPAGKTVLVAEDEINNFYLIKELLSPLELHVIRAENGLEAVRLCQDGNSPDLVLMDIGMPVMDGIEATKRIKEFNPALPVVALTAYAFESDVKNIIDSGCDEYLGKPIRQNQLMAILTKYLA